MAFSSVTYTGDSTTTTFNIPFTFLSREHVSIYLDDVLTTSYTWLNNSTIAFNTAPNTGDSIFITRSTPKNKLAVTFKDGSMLSVDDLQTFQLQLLYGMQEAWDDAQSALRLTTGYDVTGQRIINLGAPQNDGDAVNLNYVKETLGNIDPEAAKTATLAAQTATLAAQEASISASVIAAATVDELRNTLALATSSDSGAKRVGMYDPTALTGSTTASVAEILDRLLSAKSVSGIKISDYIAKYSPNKKDADQSVALQKALDDLASNAKYACLDLEGLRLGTSIPLILDSSKGGYEYWCAPKFIINGSIYSTGWTATSEDFLLTFKDGVYATARAEYLYIVNVNFHCGVKTCNGFYVKGPSTGSYYGIGFSGCIFRGFNTKGYYEDSPGHDLLISGCYFYGGEANTDYNARTSVGITIKSDDSIIVGTYTMYCKHGLDVSEGGSFFALGCHFYQGWDASPYNAENLPPAVLLGFSNHQTRFVGCYIDNGPVHIKPGADTTSVRGIYFECCLFTAQKVGANFQYISLFPGISGVVVTDFRVVGCMFRALDTAGVTVQKVIGKAPSSTGTFDVNAFSDVCVYENMFYQTKAISSIPRIRVSLSDAAWLAPVNGFKSITLDFSGLMPFGSNINLMKSVTPYVQDIVDPGPYHARRTGARTCVLTVPSTYASGWVVVQADMNTDIAV